MIPLLIGCAGTGGPVVAAPETLVPPGLPDDVQAFELQVHGMPTHGPGFAVPIAVRLPAGHSDDLWLMTTAVTEAIGPARVGGGWAVFYIPNRSDRHMVLYDGDTPHPIAASPLFYSQFHDLWDVPKPYRALCEPGAEVGHTVELSVSSPEGESLGQWRFTTRMRCPNTRALKGPEVDTQWQNMPFLEIEDVDAAGQALATCVRGELVRPKWHPHREPGADFEATWQTLTRNGETRYREGDNHAACKSELVSLLSLEGPYDDVVVRRRTVAHGPGQVPARVRPLPEGPELPLVRPEAVASGDRHERRDLVAHLDAPTSTLAPLQHEGRMEPQARDCTGDERAGVPSGERCAVLAEEPPVLEVTSGKGFWTALVLPDRELDVPYGVGPLRKPIDEGLAEVYRPMSRSNEQVLCRERRGPAADGSRPGAFARVDLAPEDACWLWVGDERLGFGWVVELGLEGTAWLRDDGLWDVSELRASHGRMQVTRLLPEAPGNDDVKRKVLSDVRLDGGPHPACTAWPRAVHVPNEVALKCPDPPKGGNLMLTAVLLPDGTVHHAEVHALEGEVPEEFGTCAVQAASSVTLEPTGCPPVPVVQRL